MWYIHTVEYYSAIKRNEILVHSITWKNLENFILRVENRHKDHILFDSTYIKGPEQANLYREKDASCLGVGVRWGMGINC